MTGNEFLFSPNSFASEIFSAFQMDIEKPSYADKPLVFAWHTDWRPRQLEEAEAAIGLPSAKTRDRQLVRGYILGAAIQIGRENLEQWISYSRNHNYYANPARKRYWPVNNMYAAVVSSVDQLAGLELIEHQRMPPGNLHWQSSFRATPELLRLFAEKKIELILAPPERILLRDAGGRPIEYRDTEQIRRWRRKLEAFNEAARSLKVSLDGHTIREGEPVVTPKNRIGASTVTMFRVFNRSFKMGGRFYGPWFQNIEKELRDTIEINGNSTEEPDYPEHHARLLYDSCEWLMPPEPFILDGWPRKVVKAAFYTLLNAETPTAARRAIAELFGRGREGYAKAGKLIAEIERKHPAVANQFGTGAGLRLMRKDSEITEYILGKLLRGGHFALPIHDSYRVPRQIADRTRVIMDEALAKATRKPTRVSMAISSTQVTDKTAKNTTSLLQNGLGLGGGGGGGGVGGGGAPPPGWVAWLPPGPASLAVLSYLYASASELDLAA
jgi:hypothetical protein